jgi:N-methylhydantoinase A
VREEGQHVECQYWKGRVTAHLAKPLLAARATNGAALAPRLRPAYFDGVGMVETPCHVGETLVPGASLAGPAIVEEATSTIVVPPGATVHVTPIGNYLIETEEGSP